MKTSFGERWVVGCGILVITAAASWSWAFDENSPYAVVAFIPSPTRWQAMQDAGLAWGRFTGFSWSDVEATQGVYDWTQADQVVADANARGIHIYAGMGYCPTWASTTGSWKGPLKDPNQWYNYVYACVSRYKDSIKYWEMWNEPDCATFWSGTWQQYIDQILKPGADAVHAADPTGYVAAPELMNTDHKSQMSACLSQAGSKINIISCHSYACGDTTSGRLAGIDSMRNTIVSSGYGDKPFWITESGLGDNSIGETAQANYITAMLTGMQTRPWWHKFFWFQIWQNDSEGHDGLLYQNETRKPSWYAYHDYVVGHPAPITISVDLNNPDIEDGVTGVQVFDGDTIPATIGGRSCRTNVDPNTDLYFYFNADDGLVYQGNEPKLDVVIDYYDTGSGTLTLQYDAAGSGNQYKNGGSVTLKGTNTWQRCWFYVTDAYFGNRQNGGADFRIARSGNAAFYLDLVQVPICLPAGSPYAAFTATPTIGPPTLHVNFDASGSSDPNGTIVSYAWDFGDGQFGSGVTTSHDYTRGGTYLAKLTVTDNSGLSNWARTQITTFGEGVSIDLGTTDVPDEMTHPHQGDGDTTATTIGSKNCRMNTDPNSDFYFYFGVSDSFAYQGSRPDLYVTIQYYDTGSGTLTLEYDSSDAQSSNPRYKNGGSVTLAGSNTWKQYTYHVTDAYFGNRQNSGADFRIAKGGGGLFYLDIVQVNVPTPTQPVIELSISSLSRTVLQGNNLPNDSFTVTNVGTDTLNYSISDNASWLSTLPTSGTITGEADTIEIIYSTASLAAGNYSATISVQDPNAANSPQTITVNLEVTPRPQIQLSISSLSRTVTEGNNLPNDTFTVTNVGGGGSTLNYTISDNASWLSTSPTSGTSTGEVDTIEIIYSTASLAVGSYSATISVQDPNATNSPQTITVNLQVTSTGSQADFDGDGDVDQEDFGHLQACLSGHGMAYGPGCQNADFDKDADVDLNDFGIFQACMGGPNRPPGC